MAHNRRTFIKSLGATSAGATLLPGVLLANTTSATMQPETQKPKVLFFDVNETLLDLTAMKQAVAQQLGGREDLLPLWFTTMLQYSLVSTVSRQYDHFGHIGAAALQMVAANHGLTISEADARQTIAGSLQRLPAHPEVKQALQQLKAAGYKLVSFTNSSNQGVKNQFQHAGLLSYFDERLSVEDVGKFKPDADTYAWVSRKMGIKPSESMLVAAHGWDVAGALWANWRAAFIARPGQQLYPLAPRPELVAADLALIAQQLVKYK